MLSHGIHSSSDYGNIGGEVSMSLQILPTTMSDNVEKCSQGILYLVRRRFIRR